MAAITVTPANVNPGSDAQTRKVQFGEAVTAGQPVYLKSSDGKYWLADADAGSAEADVVGIALTGGAADEWGIIQLDGDIDIGAPTARGEIYVLGATPGSIHPADDLAAGWYPVVLMFAENNDGYCKLAIAAGDVAGT